MNMNKLLYDKLYCDIAVVQRLRLFIEIVIIH